MLGHAEDGHADDGALLRLIDGEADDDRARLDRHVADCAACAARLLALRAQSSALSAALGTELEPVPPTLTWGAVRRAAGRRAARQRWFERPAWRAAAAVLVVVAGAAVAAPAVHHWTRARVEREWNAGAAVRAAARPTMMSVGGLAPRELAVEFAVRPRAGTLEIVADTGTSFAMEVRGAESDNAQLNLLPGRLVVLDTRTSVAAYRLRVPRSLRTLTVTIAGRLVVSADGATLSATGITVPLAP
jgi:anti-sigma factor RsiW